MVGIVLLVSLSLTVLKTTTWIYIAGVKNREVDLVIVVNMFLTGFDATTLNTLCVEKNLCYHGLIQVFSRTNRVLNSVKTFGSIVSFRNLEDETMPITWRSIRQQSTPY